MSEQRRYVRQFTASMVAYAAVLIGSVLLIRANPDAWWRYLVAVTPVVPVVVAVMAVVRRVRTFDELQQRIHLEALAFAFSCTAILTLSYGFLEGVGLPHLNGTLVTPLMAALWVIGLAMAHRRYR